MFIELSRNGLEIHNPAGSKLEIYLMLIIAAIDIGSHAIRMTVGEVDDSWKLRVIKNTRIPVRLGKECWMSHRCSHTGRIPKVTLKEGRNGWQLKLSHDLMLEKWTIEIRKALFQTVFGENLDTE